MEQKIVYLSVSNIKPYENNPRNNTFAIDAVAKSIEKNGFRAPVLVDKDMVIIAGHTRWLAAQKLGMDKVPCIVEDDMSEEQVRAYRLADNKTADNKTAEASSWNDELLQAELSALQQQGYDLLDTGFSEAELSELLDEVSDADFEDFFTEAPQETEQEKEDKPVTSQPVQASVEQPKANRIQCPHCGEWIEL